MKKTGQLATKSKNNGVQANKKNTPKKGLITPKTVQPTGKGKGVGGKKLPAKKGKSVGGKKLPPKKGKNSTKKEEEEPEDGSDLELNNMQEDSVESNGIGNGATNGSDAPNDSSSDDDDDGISGNARQLFGKILPKIQSTSDDDDDDQQGEGEDSEEENEVNPIKNQSKQEDDEEDEEDEDNEEDEDDEEDEDNEEDEENDEGNEQNNEDEDEEDNDGPHEENIKNEYPKEGIDLWKEKKGKTAKDKHQSAHSKTKLQCTVYVKRLKNRTTEEDIKKHFKSIGEITAVEFAKRGKLPSAVVTFADVASSKAAVKMNNTILNDCTILVRHALAPQNVSDNNTIRVVNVDKLEKLEGERLEKIFSKVGEIEKLSVLCEPNALAFVTFKTKEAATEALKLDGTVQDDLKIHVEPHNSSNPKTRIFISNISANATEDDLRKMFEPCGQIIDIELKRNQFGATCDLKFNTEESFCKSFLLHEEMLLGKRLNVRPFSRPTIHNKPLENNEPNSGPFQSNKPNSRGSFRGNIPRKTFQKNEPNSGPFQGNKPSSRGSFRGNWQSSRGSFRGSWQSSRGSFRGNRSSSRGSFKGNRPNSDQFNGKRQFPAPFDGQRSQPSDLWESGPPQKKTKIDMTKTQPTNE